MLKFLEAVLDALAFTKTEFSQVTRMLRILVTAFLCHLTENHNMEFLVDPASYLTALFRGGLSGHLDTPSETIMKHGFRHS